MVSGRESEKPTSRTAGARSKTMRAFRALRALRPRAALRLLPQVRMLRGFQNTVWMKAIHRITKSDGTKRQIAKRLIGAAFSTAAAFSFIPFSYALSSVWPEGTATASPVALKALGCVPANAISRWFGKFAESERLPYFVHQRLIQMVIRTYGIDVSEVEKPLCEYRTLQEFFSRRLVPNARVPHSKCLLVSPCDAEVLQVGRITDDDLILQVKGDHYSLGTLLQTKREFPAKAPGMDRLYFLFHLRPKDYHRFHCPADMDVLEAAHVPGTLHPVTYTSSKWIPGLFAKNERVSLMCRWTHGNLAFVPVGATCVGSISLGFDPRIRTNKISSVQNFMSLFRFATGASDSNVVDEVAPAVENNVVYSPLTNTQYEYEFPTSSCEGSSGLPHIQKGDELGWFNWGSAIVIIADVPEGCGFHVFPHQDVHVGDPLISW